MLLALLHSQRCRTLDKSAHFKAVDLTLDLTLAAQVCLGPSFCLQGEAAVLLLMVEWLTEATARLCHCGSPAGSPGILSSSPQPLYCEGPDECPVHMHVFGKGTWPSIKCRSDVSRPCATRACVD